MIAFSNMSIFFKAYTVETPGNGEYLHRSGNMNFTTFHNNTNSSPTVCVLGDIGVKYNASVSTLIKMAEGKEFDMVIHLGDIAYELKGLFSLIEHAKLKFNHQHLAGKLTFS